MQYQWRAKEGWGKKSDFPFFFALKKAHFPFSLFICGKCDNEGLGGKSFGLEEPREVGSKCPAPPPSRSTNHHHIATPPPPFPPSFFPWKLGGAFKGVTLSTPLPPLFPPTVLYGSRYIMAAAYRPPLLGGGGEVQRRKKASFSNGFGFIGGQRGKFESEIIVSKHEIKFFIASSKNVSESIQGSPPPPRPYRFQRPGGGRRD